MSVPPPQVVVRGEALLVVEPEIADVDVTVRVRARDRQTALERCSTRQAEVSAVVAAAGDAVEVTETTGVSVHLEVRDRRAPGEPVASLHTRLTLGRLDAVGELVVALGRLDDVDVSGPYWRLRPDSTATEQARLAAVRDAVTRARQYAAAFGAHLTALLEVSDTGLAAGVSESRGPWPRWHGSRQRTAARPRAGPAGGARLGRGALRDVRARPGGLPRMRYRESGRLDTSGVPTAAVAAAWAAAVGSRSAAAGSGWSA